MSNLDAAVVQRLAEIVHALRSGQPLEIAGDDVDQAVALLSALMLRVGRDEASRADVADTINAALEVLDDDQ